jgi:SSS family solute:Na+ symporter
MVYFVLIAYLSITFGLGFISRRNGQVNPESYFLSNRNLKTLALFFSLIATNFSAFFFLGFAGEGYNKGYAYYPMMAFGTSFAALTFYLVGNKAWHLGKQKGYITPVEVIRGETKSELLSNIFMVFMVLFMLPYLAVQPIGAGLILETITEGYISYPIGVTIMILFILVYVAISGMRGVVLMDIKNGVIMLSLMVLAIYTLGSAMGGIEASNQKVYQEWPDLFSPRGKDEFFTPLKWLSFIVLWVTCLPMFPQIFTRFLMSRELKNFKRSTILYSFIPPFLFIIPVMIGVLGHVDFINLMGKEADAILPKMLYKYTEPWFSALILTGALAAFISTVDSVVLAIAGIFTRDVYLTRMHPEASMKEQVWVGRIFIVFLALISLAIALIRPASIFKILTISFSGSSLLFPVVLAVFYFKDPKPLLYSIALLIGELVLFSLTFGWINPEIIGSALPILPSVALTSAIIVIGQKFSSSS